MKKKSSEIPETLNEWTARLASYPANTPQAPPVPKPVGNDEKLVAKIEAQKPWLRLEYLLHESTCVAPCKCRARAFVTKFARYGKPTNHIVVFRE